MKSFQLLIIWTAFNLLTHCVSSKASDESSTQQSFNATAAGIADRRPWVPGGGLSRQQEQTYEYLKKQAASIMRQPDHEVTLLALLDTYKDQDAYPRQALLYTIIGNVNYLPKDLPFLKRVFLAAADFHYDEYPYKEGRWIGPFKTRTGLADLILGLSDKEHLPDIPDIYFLLQQPKAWLAKYAP